VHRLAANNKTMWFGRTTEELSDMIECEVLDIFGTRDCAYAARKILGWHKMI
jgi:hypothetical protein